MSYVVAFRNTTKKDDKRKIRLGDVLASESLYDIVLGYDMEIARFVLA